MCGVPCWFLQLLLDGIPSYLFQMSAENPPVAWHNHSAVPESLARCGWVFFCFIEQDETFVSAPSCLPYRKLSQPHACVVLYGGRWWMISELDCTVLLVRPIVMDIYLWMLEGIYSLKYVAFCIDMVWWLRRGSHVHCMDILHNQAATPPLRSSVLMPASVLCKSSDDVLETHQRLGKEKGWSSLCWFFF